MIESFVDLTYRGVSLGRRVRLSQVRPSSGYLELPAPMPVGTQIAIAADDGVTFEATVAWSYEQVAGASRPPGMTVTPALTAGPAAAWWAARVVLPDDDVAGQATVAGGGRSRPVTARRRSDSMPPAVGAVTGEITAVAADLDARVAAVDGHESGRAAGDAGEAGTAVMPALALPADALAGGGSGGEPERPAEELAEPPGEASMMRRTGEHDVVDDGSRTVIMESLDPATLDVEPGAADEAGGPDASEDPDPGDGAPAGDGSPPSGGGRTQRKLRR